MHYVRIGLQLLFWMQQLSFLSVFKLLKNQDTAAGCLAASESLSHHWVITGVMKPTWVLATCLLHQSQVHFLQIVSFGYLSTCGAARGATCRAACLSVTGTNGHKPLLPQKISSFPLQVGHSSLWQCGVCGLGPTAGTKQRLWNHITWNCCLWKWLQMLHLDYHVWVSTTIHPFMKQSGRSLPKRRVTMCWCLRTFFFLICSFTKDIYMKACVQHHRW